MATTYVLCSRDISRFVFQVTHSNLSKSLYALGRSRLNFGMIFESTIKALKPDIFPFTSCKLQVLTGELLSSTF